LSRFVSIATTDAGTQAGLIIAVLESCGIDVLTRNYNTAITCSQYTHAVGGIDIYVPAKAVREASDILIACGPFEPPSIKPWVVPFLIFAYLFAAVPPPGTGVILRRDQSELVFG